MESNRLCWVLCLLLLAGCAAGNKLIVPGTTLTGKVTMATSEAEVLLPGVTVQVKKNGQVLQEAVTDNNGGFVFHDLPSGGFQIAASKGEDWEPIEEDLRAEAFRNGFGDHPITLSPRETALTGRVLTEVEGKRVPVEGIQVTTYPPTIETKTNPTGNYTISSGSFRPEILYAVSVKGEDYYPEMVRAENLRLARSNPVPDILLKLQLAVTDTSIARKRNLVVIRDSEGNVLRLKHGTEAESETRQKR